MNNSEKDIFQFSVQVMKKISILLLSLFISNKICFAQENIKSFSTIIWLDSLDLSTMETGWGQPQQNATINGMPLRLGGQQFPHGVGSHANSEYSINLHGNALRFEALVGIDDEVGGNQGSVNFKVFTDNKLIFESGIMREKEQPKKIDVSLLKSRVLKLVIEDCNDKFSWDHADWAMAKIIISKNARQFPTPLYRLGPSTPQILTPKSSKKPRINGPAIYGATPGAPFLYLVPATGDEPLQYTAENLPRGLAINTVTGVISGSVQQKGSYHIRLKAENKQGRFTKQFEIRIGDTIALTPPLGWNHWNCFDVRVDETKIKSAADAFIKNGLAKHGWSYINIDDGWQGDRDQQGNIQGNKNFPDMKGLGDYIHRKGLKFGIYSSPGPTTCGNFQGSQGYEKQDAATFARWGVDYLKYDWCSCRNTDLKAPYRLMDSLLKNTGRDIFYSLCQYGMGEVWKWGVTVGGNAWRTSGDINDTWGSLNIGFSQNGMEPYAGRGRWNDPDMMIIGWVSTGLPLHLTRLKPAEQYTHVTLWSLLAAPMLIGCDLTKLDDFTLNLLTNDEVLDINQDQLCKQGYRIAQHGKTEIWAKPLYDGSYAVAFFNRGLTSEIINMQWKTLRLKGPQQIRDLWRQKNIAIAKKNYSARVEPHGTLFIKITPAKKSK